jgi:hypothetical protein
MRLRLSGRGARDWSCPIGAFLRVPIRHLSFGYVNETLVQQDKARGIDKKRWQQGFFARRAAADIAVANDWMPEPERQRPDELP